MKTYLAPLIVTLMVQAKSLFAMSEPSAYPAAAFEDALNSVLFYSEHTRGAWSSITDPDCMFSKDQWEVKQGYALAALQSITS